jgi:hypothetical protein
MKLQGAAEGNLIGSDFEAPEFDPLGLTKGIDEKKYFYYRAAELKHGRLAMLAAFGQLVSYYVQLPDPVFSQVCLNVLFFIIIYHLNFLRAINHLLH